MRERIFLLVTFLFLSACADSFPPEFPVPEFSLKSPLTDEIVNNETIKGKPVIIYWFASW